MTKTRTILNGAIVGAGMSIPGFSGGTLAMMLGIYDRLLYSVSNLREDIRKHGSFLLLSGSGGCVGLLLSALLVSRLLASPAGLPLRFAFVGAAAGCVPPMLHEAKALPLTLKKLLLILCGGGAALLVSLLPSGLLTSGEGIAGTLLQMLGGALVSAALVLPGISASQMLYVLGLYEPALAHVASGELLPLLPLAVGAVVGLFLTAKALSALLQRFDGTYCVVLGFMLYSVKEMIPPIFSATELLLGFVCAAVGFTLVTLCSGKSQ